jgi:MFS family permease
MRLFVDTTPLRASRDFRRLYIGQAVSFIGSTVTMAALPFQVFHQTGSSVAVGLLGVVQLGPLLLFSLVGGALADSLDKRRLLVGVTATALACSAGLAVNASLGHPQLWLLYVLGAASSGTFAISFPVLRSLLPLLLEEELRPAAFALQSTYGSFGMMAGPALAGVLIAVVGLASAYIVDVGTYLVAVMVFAGIAPSPPVAGSRAASTSSVIEGLRFLRGHSVIMSTFGIDLLAMVFGMPRALFPALAQRLGGGAVMYGLLLSSVAAGAFVASLVSGWTIRVQRQGRAVLWAVTAWGTAIGVAGLVHVPAVVMVLLAGAGAADMISGVYRSTITAAVTPDGMRGRVSGVEIAVYAGGPVLGDIEAGLVGGLLGVPFAIVSGGLACVVSAAAFATGVRSFANYRRPAAPTEVAKLASPSPG